MLELIFFQLLKFFQISLFLWQILEVLFFYKTQKTQTIQYYESFNLSSI